MSQFIPARSSGTPTSNYTLAPVIIQKTDSFTQAGDDAWHDVTGLTGLAVTTTTATQKVRLSLSVMASGTDQGSPSGMRIVRGSTPVAIGDAAGSRLQVTQGNFSFPAFTSISTDKVFHDAPAAAGTYTYKVQVYAESGSNIYVNRCQTDANDVHGARGVSTLEAQVYEP